MLAAATIFSVLAVILIALAGLLVLVTIAEFALGLLVLDRGGRTLPARFLGSYLLLQPFSFGVTFLGLRIESPEISFPGYLGLLTSEPVLSPYFFASAAFATLPSTLLAFALSYPVLHPALRGRRAWLALPFLPCAPLVLLASAPLARTPFAPPDSGFLAEVFLYAATYLVVGTGLAALLLWVRARHASTDLERRRLRYMAKVLTPIAVGMAGLLLSTIPTFSNDILFLLAVFAITLLFATVVLVPAIGMGFGLLRYRILDLERTVRAGARFTLSRGLVAATFVLVFFAVSEGAERILVEQTQSNLVGLVGAGLLAFAFDPLQRATNRIAARAIPVSKTPAPPDRRLEVYRATYEEVTTDRRLTQRERTALESMAKNLGLTAEDVRTVEVQVARERAAAAR